MNSAGRAAILVGNQDRLSARRLLTRLVRLIGLLRLPHNDRMAARYEYKALELREKYTGRRLSGDKLEKVLNEHAAQGWQLKFLTRAGGGGLNNLRIFVTFERQID